MALKGIRCHDIDIVQEGCKQHIHSSEQRMLTSASNSNTLAGFPVLGCEGSDFQVNAVIIEKEVLFGNFLIEPHVSVKLRVTLNWLCLVVWMRRSCALVFRDHTSLQTICLERLQGRVIGRISWNWPSSECKLFIVLVKTVCTEFVFMLC